MGWSREAYEYIRRKSAKKNAQRRRKYRNVPSEADGIKFDSKKERDRYVDLKLIEKAGGIKDLKVQPKFTFPMGFSYYADFEYFDCALNKIIVEDTKGVKTQVFNLKRKCMDYFYPDLELRIVS